MAATTTTTPSKQPPPPQPQLARRSWETGAATEPLPVPPLAVTVYRLLQSAAPLSSNTGEFEAVALLCLEFLQTAGPALQAALQRRATAMSAQHSKSYLIDWWNRLMYTSWRLPLPLNVSYWYAFTEDALKQVDAACREASPHLATHRAAALVLGAAAARDALWSGSFPLDASGGRRCDARMYRYIFHACRFPRPGEDGVRVYDGAGPTAPGDFIVVLRRGQLFAVSLQRSVKAGGGRCSRLELAARLRAVVLLADHQQPIDPTIFPLGLLTAAHRDTIATALPLLVGDAAMLRPSHGAGSSPATQGDEPVPPLCPVHAANLSVLATIESCLLVLCLDTEEPGDGRGLPALSRRLLDGAPANRWYDKAVQLVVTDSGEAGFIGEHSHCDGMPTAHLLGVVFSRYMQERQAREQPQVGPDQELDAAAAREIAQLSASSPLGNRVVPPAAEGAGGVVPLAFRYPQQKMQDDKALRSLLLTASAEVAKQRSEHELHVVVSQGYGADDVKRRFGVSPDAWAQMAMQLAHLRWKGCFVGTYEPAHARRFAWGRTACVRVVSAQSCEWASAFAAAVPADGAGAIEPLVALRLHRLLQAASAAHSATVRAALSGQDIDRHWLGLKLIGKEPASDAGLTPADSSVAPALFAHPAVVRSGSWKLSTSNLTMPFIANWGFGEVCEGGLGVGYSTAAGCFRYNIVGEVGSPAAFAAVLRRALLDMAAVAAAAGSPSAVGAGVPKL